MRQPGSITMVEIQRLVGEQAIGLESLRLHIEEMTKLLPKTEVADVVDVAANGKEPVGVSDG